MPTRSAVALLFALLIAVPVGSAIYLGTAGLRRERGMLIEQERRAMESIADEVRDRLVSQLQALYRSVRASPLPRRNDRRAPVYDRFELRAGQLEGPWGRREEIPEDIRALGRRPLDPGHTTSLRFLSDLAVWEVDGVVRGFRVDPRRVAERFLEPESLDSVVRHFSGERFEYARLVSEDQRVRPKPDRFGFAHVRYRYVVPEVRDAEPMLLPPGYLLEVGTQPSQALADQLDASGKNLVWILGAVGVVVLLGLLFAWRALRAESRLAARKAEFVSAVSHELRTPLTSIRMYAEMLKEGWIKDNSTAQDYFALISVESERLARLVNNVLDFSQIEKGKKTFNMRLGDLAPVVRDVVEVLRPYLRQKGFDLVVEVPESLPACRFDKDALTQIMVNLIDNAVKYGAKEVRIEAESRDGEVVLRVLDRGPGVAAEERETIFRAFERGANTETGGSGLGLALVQHYVTAHEGHIEVVDREGGGAVFALRLPAA